MDETEPSPKSPFTALRIVVVLAVLVIVCAIGARFMVNQRAGNQQVYDNLDVFGTRLQNLENSTILHEKRIKELEETTQKLAASTPATAAAPSSTAAASGGPETLSPSSAAADSRIEALEKEVAALKSASPPKDNTGITQSIRLLSAFHRLSDKVIGGKPFAAELSAFVELASPDEPAGSPLATLAPYADSGIPTFATLLVTFDQSVEGLNSTQALPPAGSDFWQRFKYNMTHLVSVRRIDEAQMGSTADAIVGRAQAHLEREEVEAAMAEIKSLPENARSNFTAWLDDAQMVTEAPSLMDRVEEQVLQKAFHAEAPAAAEQATNKPSSPEQPSSPQTPKL